MFEVICVMCDYETVLFEAEDLDDGRACPCCDETVLDALDEVLAEHPLPVVDGRPGLVRDGPAARKLRVDFPVIEKVARDHGYGER